MILILFRSSLVAFTLVWTYSARSQTLETQLSNKLIEPPGMLFSDLSTRCVIDPSDRTTIIKDKCEVLKIELTQFIDSDAENSYIVMQDQRWSVKNNWTERHFALLSSDKMDGLFKRILPWVKGSSDSYKFFGTQTGMLGTFAVIEGMSGAAGRGIDHTVISRRGTKWYEYQADLFSEIISKKMPDGYYIPRAPLAIDYGTGFALYAIHAPGDSMATSTGGSIVVQLSIKGNRFVTETFRIDPRPLR